MRIATTLGALGLTALATTSALAQDVIKIPNIIELSGGGATVGTMWKNASTMAAEEINAKGGILGKKIQLVYPGAVVEQESVRLIHPLHDVGVDLFSDVMAAFNAKQYNKARRLAGKHRKRYPTSPFSESCELIIIRAHCKMGESRKAREMVREFSRESPNSGASRARLAQVLTRCR